MCAERFDDWEAISRPGPPPDIAGSVSPPRLAVLAATPPRRRTDLLRTPLAAAAVAVLAAGYPAYAQPADPSALRRIVLDECLPNVALRGGPWPCVRLDPADGGGGRGFAVLKDRRGLAQYLVLPTRPVSGIEDPLLLAPDAPNVFAAAWRARPFLWASLGRRLDRREVGLALNAQAARSQDLFHIHLDCLRAEVRDRLAAGLVPAPSAGWVRLAEPLAGAEWWGMALAGEELAEADDPIRLLADGLPAGNGAPARPGLEGARTAMGAFGLALAGAVLPDGRPGFVALARRGGDGRTTGAWSEALLDHACGGERDGPPLP